MYCNLLLWGLLPSLVSRSWACRTVRRGTTFGFEARGSQPFGLGAPGSVEPLGSEVPYRSQQKSGGLDAARRKRSPPAMSDDDGRRGKLLKPKEEGELSLVCERSRARLESAPKCAMKRWSGGRVQARFEGMIDLNTQRNALWLMEGGEDAWKQSGISSASVCSVKKRKLNRIFTWCWFQCVQVWWKCQAIVQATKRWNAKLFGQNERRCVVYMCIPSMERKEQLFLHACAFWTGMFTNELANSRFHRKIADF